MKKVTLFVAAAMIVGFGSAFTAKESESSSTVFVDMGDGENTPYEEALEHGDCIEGPTFCKYTLAPDGTTKVPEDSQRIWQENN